MTLQLYSNHSFLFPLSKVLAFKEFHARCSMVTVPSPLFVMCSYSRIGTDRSHYTFLYSEAHSKKRENLVDIITVLREPRYSITLLVPQGGERV